MFGSDCEVASEIFFYYQKHIVTQKIIIFVLLQN